MTGGKRGMLSKRELRRQVMHILVGVITAALVYFEILRPFTVFLLLIVGVLISFLSKRVRIPLVAQFLDVFEREEQRFTFPGRGVIFFFIGVLLVLRLFPRDIALAAILVLALGDSISHIIGGQFGQTKNIFNGDSRKLLEGNIVGALVGFVGALIFVPLPEAFFGSCVAMAAEMMQFDLNQRQVDDNIIVPLVAGTTMLLVRYVAGLV